MKKIIRSSVPALLLLASLVGQPFLYGQSPVTSFSASYITTLSVLGSYVDFPASLGTFSGCASTSYLYTFSNGLSNQYKLNSFNANGSSYFVAPASSASVKLRRVNNSNATGNRNIVYMESTLTLAIPCLSPAILNFKPPYLDVMETVLNAGMLNQGTDNIFTNAGNGDGNNNNIERVDIIFSSGLNTASPSEAGFAIFDRGNNYQHDPFKIAAITSLDANGDPASFGPVRTCTGGNSSNNNGSWGHPSAANGNLSFSIYVMRKDASAPRLQVSSNLNQEVGGVFYTFASLGIAAGQPLYGYALLGADGAATPSSAQLLDLTNTAVYPTGTTEAQGGLDLVAVNTVFSTGSYIVLPVGIASFTGSLQQDATGAPAGRQLQWELGNVGGGGQVSLERAVDGVNFSTVYSTTISSAATPLSMKYTDVSEINSTLFYYRLKITPPSGSSQYSNTLVLLGNGANAGWKIYPTIAERSQQLKLEGVKDGDYTVAFYDYGGACRKVSVHVLNKEAWIDQPSGGLVSGIYWLQLSGNGQAIPGGTKIFVR